MRHNKRILGLAATAAAVAIALAAVAGPALAGAPNMVTNGDFASNVNGWTGNPLVGITWSAGHGEVSLKEDKATATGGFVLQCLGAALPGHTYQYGGDVYIPSGQPRGGFGTIVITFYTGANCGGGYAGAKSTTQILATDAWYSVANTMTAPQNSVSVAIWLNPSKKDIKYGGLSSDVFTAWYDNIFVADQGQDPNAPTPTPTNPPPPQGSPIPTKTPTKSPTASPTPQQTVPATTTVIPMLTPAPENTPIVIIPGGDWPTITPPPATSTPKPSNTPVTTPPTKDVPQQPQTTPSLPEQHTSESSHPEGQATPLPPTTGSGISGSASSSSVLAAGLVLLLVSGASLLGARRRKS